MADDTVRFALLGCGRIAQRYGDIFANDLIRGGSVTAVCDIVEDARDKMAAKLGVPGYATLDAMMQAEGARIDAVCILTESGFHPDHTIAVAGYGKHAIVEKPMALTLDDADRMIAACDRAGVKLFVVKQNRYNVPVQKLREAFDAGRFGKMVMGTVRVRWCRRQDYYDQADWRGTWAMDGGVFSNQASHHIDLLEWFLGKPVSVVSKTRTALVNIEAEDTGAALITFESGAIGIVEATTATRPKDLEGSLSLLGENGSVEIGGFAVNEMRHWRFEQPMDEDAEVLEKYRENPPNVYGYGHTRYLQNVSDVLISGAPSLVDGLEGRKSLELINALYESVATEKEIHLNFTARHSPLGRRPKA